MLIQTATSAAAGVAVLVRAGASGAVLESDPEDGHASRVLERVEQAQSIYV